MFSLWCFREKPNRTNKFFFFPPISLSQKNVMAWQALSPLALVSCAYLYTCDCKLECWVRMWLAMYVHLQAASAAAVIPLQPQENIELASQLKRLESSFSIFAEESNPNQLLAHLGRMAVEFHHLSSKVQKNEQRTSLLQVRGMVLCTLKRSC